MYTYFLNMPIWAWFGFVLVGLPWRFLVYATSTRTLGPEYLRIEYRFAIGWPIIVAGLAAWVSCGTNNWSPKAFSTMLVILWMLNNGFLLATSAPYLREGSSETGRLLWKPTGLVLCAICSVVIIIVSSENHTRMRRLNLASYHESKSGRNTVIVFPSKFEPILGSASEIVGWQIVQKTHPELELFLASGQLGIALQSAYFADENQQVRVQFEDAPQNGQIVVSVAAVEPIVWQP